MVPVRNILFPVDFSERSAAAAGHVVAMAKRFDARVTLLNVFQTPAVWRGGFADAPIDTWVDVDQLAKERQQDLDSYLDTEFMELPQVERIVVQGDPAVVIADYARTHGVDLIMMATHGYGPFRRLLLGSVAAKVLHDANCPVWTDVHAETPLPHTDCRTVMCAVDLRKESIVSIQWAADFASSNGADLVLMHAIPSVSTLAPPEEWRFHATMVDISRKFIDDMQAKAGTHARVRVESGKISSTVRSVALEQQADLVVIGQGCMHQALGHLRTNAYAIIRESPCPVIRI